jgi:hypothetical protein
MEVLWFEISSPSTAKRKPPMCGGVTKLDKKEISDNFPVINRGDGEVVPIDKSYSGDMRRKSYEGMKVERWRERALDFFS